jgi:hypothetical protein
MTDVEFSRLLSDLGDTAKKLNKASDSINDIIKRFQDTLRSMNVGLEVWQGTIASELWNETDEDEGTEYPMGFIDTELGFARLEGEWALATRAAKYEWQRVPNGDYDQDGVEGTSPLIERNRASLYSVANVTPLLECSRAVRIDALKHFPAIARALHGAAQKAIDAIETARAFVK